MWLHDNLTQLIKEQLPFDPSLRQVRWHQSKRAAWTFTPAADCARVSLSPRTIFFLVGQYQSTISHRHLLHQNMESMESVFE